MKNTGSANIGYVIFLSIVAALGGILFGYDTAVISGTTADVSAQFGLSEMSKGWYVGCALVGSIIGVAVAGLMSDYLGRKITLLIAALLFSVSAIGCCLCDRRQEGDARLTLPAGHHPGSAAGLPCKLYHTLRKRFGLFLQPLAAEDFLFRDVARDAGQRERGDSVLPDYRLLHP